MPTLPQKGAPHKLAEVDWAAALEADMQVVVRNVLIGFLRACPNRRESDELGIAGIAHERAILKMKVKRDIAAGEAVSFEDIEYR